MATAEINDHRDRIIRLLSHSNARIVSDGLKEHLDAAKPAIIVDRSPGTTKIIKLKTRLFYKQQRCNLLLKDNDGYTKLIGDLNNDTGPSIRSTVSSASRDECGKAADSQKRPASSTNQADSVTKRIKADPKLEDHLNYCTPEDRRFKDEGSNIQRSSRTYSKRIPSSNDNETSKHELIKEEPPRSSQRISNSTNRPRTVMIVKSATIQTDRRLRNSADSSCDGLINSLEPEIIINELDSQSDDSQLFTDNDENKQFANGSNGTGSQINSNTKSQYEYRNGQFCLKSQGHHEYVAKKIARTPRPSTSAFSVPLSIPSSPRTSTSGPDLSFDEEILVDVHYRKQKGSIFICLVNNCNKEISQSSNLFYHINSVHKMIRYQCPYCPVLLTTKYQVCNHCRKAHYDILDADKTLLGEKGRNLLNLIKMVNFADIQHEEESNSVLDSSLISSNGSPAKVAHIGIDEEIELNVHYKKDRSGNFICLINNCGKESGQSSNLFYHINSVHRQIRFACPFCTTKLTTKYGIINHCRKSHAGMRFDPKTIKIVKVDEPTHQPSLLIQSTNNQIKRRNSDSDEDGRRISITKTEDSSCDALLTSLEPEIIINELDSQSDDSQLFTDNENKEFSNDSNDTGSHIISPELKAQFDNRHDQFCFKNQGHHAYVAEKIARSPRPSTSAFSVPLSIPSTPRSSTSGPDLSFDEEILLDVHYRKLKGSIFICLVNHCNKEISQSSNLFYHINSVHKMIRYQCPYCPVVLTTKYQVCNHCRKAHYDILDADQTLLGEKGRNLLNLIKIVNFADVQQEEENKSENSDSFNGSTAKVAQIGIDEEIELNVHYKKDRSGNFICLINNCGKESGQSSNLFYHINSVHRQIRFACPFCTTKLTTKYGIINHCRKFHGGLRFDPKAIQVVKVSED